MPGIEDTFYDFSKSCMLYGLIAFNYLSWAWDYGFELTRKSVRGAIHAHYNKEWIFTSRNSIPWVVFENSNKFPMRYNPTDHVFLFLTDDKPNQSFGDVVTAELKYNEQAYDASSLFHNVKWYSGSELTSPSLYEISLVYCLENNLLFTKEEFDKGVLKILTADGKTITQDLNSPKSLLNFDKWEVAA